MKKNQVSNNNSIVYSTNPDWQPEEVKDDIEDLKPSQQKLRLHLERLKGNKTATVVRGYIGKEDTLEIVGKMLKTKCGVGGTVKENEIILQGDFRDKVLALLVHEGFTQTKKAGG